MNSQAHSIYWLSGDVSIIYTAVGGTVAIRDVNIQLHSIHWLSGDVDIIYTFVGCIVTTEM